MIYVPGKLLFIHIPRSGGNAITRTLAKQLIDRDDVFLCTAHLHKGPFRRHARACCIRRFVDDFDKVPKFAIHRPLLSIVRSDMRLHHAAYHPEMVDDGQWIGSVVKSMSESPIEFYRRRWASMLGGVTHWQFWCCDLDGSELGVTRLPFHDMDYSWSVIRDAAGISNSVALPHMDWQKRVFEEDVKARTK